MPVKGCNNSARVCSVYRTIEYRLLPGSRGKKLAGIAGACRFVWNTILAQSLRGYQQAKESGEKPPSVKVFSLGKRFKELRDHGEWLPEYSFNMVRYTLKYQADAWKACFEHGKRRSSMPNTTVPHLLRFLKRSRSRMDDYSSPNLDTYRWELYT